MFKCLAPGSGMIHISPWPLDSFKVVAEGSPSHQVPIYTVCTETIDEFSKLESIPLTQCFFYVPTYSIICSINKKADSSK